MIPGLNDSELPAAQWKSLFQTCCRKHGLATGTPELNLSAFRRLTPGQAGLF